MEFLFFFIFLLELLFSFLAMEKQLEMEPSWFSFLAIEFLPSRDFSLDNNSLAIYLETFTKEEIPEYWDY